MDVLGIAGLLIGVVGLIALRPQLSVSMEAPLEAGQPYQPVFKITNTGLTAITKVHAYAYMHKIQVGGISFSQSISGNSDWKATTLERGESFTVATRLMKTRVTPTSFDVAAVVQYAPYGIPFITQSRVFRWVGTKASDGNMTLLPQASDEIRDDALKATERFKESHDAEQRAHSSN